MKIDLTEAELLMIRETGFFDEPHYRGVAGLEPAQDALGHYLKIGWSLRLAPSRDVDFAFLAPYFASVGFSGPPLLTLAVLKFAGWPIYQRRDQLELLADSLRSSHHFDESYYRKNAKLLDPRLDAAFHYLLVGEKLGFKASKSFEPAYYAERNPDVVAAGLNVLCHFIQHGQFEGRRGMPVAAETAIDPSKFSASKETVVVVSHEASRTGAPILALNIAEQLATTYNVVSIVFRGGALVNEFKSVSSHLLVIKDGDRTEIELRYFVKSILNDGRKVRFAIVNSIESRDILKHLTKQFVPTIMLMHEFSSYTRPLESVRQALAWATKIVFSAQLVLDSAVSEHPNLAYLGCEVIPQGRCDLSKLISADNSRDEFAKLKRAMRPHDGEGDFVVLGAGSFHIRKGVDLFLMAAAEIARRMPDLRLRFIWIGHGYQPDRDTTYSVYVREQIDRAGLADRVQILNEVTDIEKAYAMADAFFLSSRLDPLPNVTIDASIHGLPVVCFEKASGFAEILLRDPALRGCVVPYLDVDAAATAIIDLATDGELRRQISDAIAKIGRETFEMSGYIDRLKDVGRSATGAMAQRRDDFDAIAGDPLFDQVVFLSASTSGEARVDAIKRFLAYWSFIRLAPDPLKVLPDFRRPCVGFHPQIYAQSNRLREGENPLADYIRRGYPAGPWSHTVFKPTLADCQTLGPSALRVAIHGHFHYPELIVDFLAKLRQNKSRCDLYLSTSSKEKAEYLEALTAQFELGSVVIRVVPNRGRDIGPFLTAFREELTKDYDVVGHFHGKRSVAIDAVGGEIWREFLWQHLIGDFFPTMDYVLARFEANAKLGIVFPEDPHLVGWSENHAIADALAARMEFASPLPAFHEFPVGTMFWARREALLPLFDLKLAWTDYPEEPIRDDGTILHAIERLLPLAASHAGFGFATTHIVGISR